MKTTMTTLLAATLTLAFTGSAAAQQTPNLDKREAAQQKRISQGVRSGELTQREAARLDANQARLKAHESAAKADGKVTPQERARLQREANRNSRQIAKQKHDAQQRP